MLDLGMSKHRKSGTPPTAEHFTGKRASNGHVKRVGLSRKQRALRRGSHHNKYAGDA